MARILQAWNIGAESVLFVDDSPIELAEVQAAHPQIECILFPKDDPVAAMELFYRLREIFGKAGSEDGLRLTSISQCDRDAIRISESPQWPLSVAQDKI